MIKRIFDIIFSFLGLMMLSPFLVLIAILIKLDSRGPVFYLGERVGKDGKLFKIFKFRSMVENAEELGGADTPSDDPRLTKIGKFLRAYNLDEFPQLINVLKGEMSIVGPRPEVAWKVERYTKDEKRILSIPPGMTDYASIKFSDEGKILLGSPDPEKTYAEKIRPEKIRLELEYVKKYSLWIDIKIIFKTLLIAFRR